MMAPLSQAVKFDEKLRNFGDNEFGRARIVRPIGVPTLDHYLRPNR